MNPGASSPSSLPDPEPWLRDILGAPLYYPKQVEVLDAIRHHARVSVVGANSMGKDWTTGRAIHYWLSNLDPAKVVIVAPTYRQIYDVVWMEALAAYRDSTKPLGGRIYNGQVYLYYAPERWALGFSTDRAYGFQGFHSPHLLVIITEAHGMRQADIDAIKKLNPECILMTGNPLSMSGEFRESHHEKAHLWHTITISAEDSPNIIEGRDVIPGLLTKEDIARYAADWGEESPLYRATVLSEWDDGSSANIIVPLSWAKAAETRDLPAHGDTEVFGCDVAGEGRDYTVIYRRVGNVARLVHRVHGHDTMQTVGILAGIWEEHTKPEVGLNVRLVVDMVGIGSGVVHRLREIGIPVTAFVGGSRANEPRRFFNRIAEMWWRMREYYEDEHLDIDPNPNLVSQISSRPYRLRSDRLIQLLSKADMDKSPDDGDALAMTFEHAYQRRMAHFNFERDDALGPSRQSRQLGTGQRVVDDDGDRDGSPDRTPRSSPWAPIVGGNKGGNGIGGNGKGGMFGPMR